ncbi:MAG: DNA topology modulation protein [Pyrinomonadaceae bacterium]
MIIGSSGAGKSTLAVKLAAKTGLPVIHLDQLHFSPDWIAMPKEQWQEKVAHVSAGDSWIIDGNYSGTMETRLEKCDTVIFLDLPRITCVYRVLKRVIIYGKQTRPDMADGCNERFDWKFIKWVWHYPNRSKPKVEYLLKLYGKIKKVVRLKSQQEIEQFLLKQ